MPPSIKLALKALLARLNGKLGHAQPLRQVFSRDESNPKLVNETGAGLRILICDDHLPAPDRDAGSARMILILKSLLGLGRPVFISLSDLAQPDREEALRNEGIETAFWADYKQLLRERNFDLAILSRPDVAEALLKTIRKTSPRTLIIFDTVDISFVRLGREGKLTGDKAIARKAARYQKLEGQLARACDQVWCVTEEDQRALAPLAPAARFEIIPTIHPLQKRGKAFDERHGALFIGNYLHRPNEDAVHYLMTDVLPLIRTACPDFKLFIVGDHASAAIRGYASEKVIVTGFVADVDDIFHNCRVFVAPLRFGSGMKGKIGQALSFGVPVVTTPIGAEGMELEHGNQAMIAEGPREFADAVINLYQDAALWQRLSDNGREHVRRNFTPEVVEEKICRAVRNLVS